MVRVRRAAQGGLILPPVPALAAGALSALLLGCAGAGQAPAERAIARLDGTTIDPAALTARIEELTREAGVQGLTVVVFNDGEAVYSRAFGIANLETRRPLRTDTVLYGASLSKAVFSVLVMRLVERGVIDLDTRLQDYIDEPLWVNRGEAWHENLSDLRGDERYRKITARMCLSHTSGFPNWRWFEPDEKLRIRFDPGARYGYSGEGFTFLQIVLEKLTGKRLEQLMRQEIFEPFGMATSSYIWQPRFERDYAVGHRANGTVYPKDKDNAARAASTLETTTEDYARFLRAVLRGEGLTRASWKEIFSPQVYIRFRTQFGPGATEETTANDAIELSYGLGWGLLRTPHGRGAFKEGHGDGFQHYSIVFPESGLGVLLMSNSDNAEGIFDQLLEATLADTYTPVEWEGYTPYDQKPSRGDTTR